MQLAPLPMRFRLSDAFPWARLVFVYTNTHVCSINRHFVCVCFPCVLFFFISSLCLCLSVHILYVHVFALEKAKPDKWGCVHTCELWSPKEETRHVSWTQLDPEVWVTVLSGWGLLRSHLQEWDHWFFPCSGVHGRLLERAVCHWLRPKRSDTTTTRDDDVWRPVNAWCGAEKGSRHGYHEVCTLRGLRQWVQVMMWVNVS